VFLLDQPPVPRRHKVSSRAPTVRLAHRGECRLLCPRRPTAGCGYRPNCDGRRGQLAGQSASDTGCTSLSRRRVLPRAGAVTETSATPQTRVGCKPSGVRIPHPPPPDQAERQAFLDGLPAVLLWLPVEPEEDTARPAAIMAAVMEMAARSSVRLQITTRVIGAPATFTGQTWPASGRRAVEGPQPDAVPGLHQIHRPRIRAAGPRAVGVPEHGVVEDRAAATRAAAAVRPLDADPGGAAARHLDQLHNRRLRRVTDSFDPPKEQCVDPYGLTTVTIA
jgi:hypothetical protein